MSLKTDIEGLSDSQIARINKNDSRVICNKDEGRLTSSAASFADSVHAQIEALSVQDFNDLNASLIDGKKLNHDPC